MRRVFQAISWIALAATVAPPILFLRESMGLDQAKRIMLLATIVWFAATPLWMGRKRQRAAP